MNIKFHWGHGIFIFLSIFLLTMGFVVYKSFQEKNALVESEYYTKGLVYQKQIERISNADTLSAKIRYAVKDGSVVISYPQLFRTASPTGSIFFYRPSDDAGDQTVKISVDSSLQQIIPAGKLMAGKYIVKANWQMQGKEFYHEETILVK